MPESPAESSGRRVDYIDLLRGLTILWVVWHHVDYYAAGHEYRMPLFAFLAGIFFKREDFRTLMSKMWRQLLLPFCFFWVLSWMVVLLMEICHIGEPSGYGCVGLFLSFLGMSPYHHALVPVNGPMWFLLCVCWMRLFGHVLMRMPVMLTLGVVAVLIWYKYSISFVSTPLALNSAVGLLPFFMAGNLCGRRLISLLSCRTGLAVTAIVSIAVLIITGGVAGMATELWPRKWFAFVHELHVLSFIVTVICAFSVLDGLPVLEFLRFYGRNSLIVLSTHIFAMKLFGRPLFFLLDDVMPVWSAMIVATVAVAVALVPVILGLNRWLPAFVGKGGRSMKICQS